MADMNGKVGDNYIEGLKDGVTQLASFCDTHTCELCPINMLAGEKHCMQWAAENPTKVLSILMDEGASGHSNYEEFLIRNPECVSSVEEIAQTCCCGMMFYGGVCDVESEPTESDCLECWKKHYIAPENLVDDTEGEDE